LSRDEVSPRANKQKPNSTDALADKDLLKMFQSFVLNKEEAVKHSDDEIANPKMNVKSAGTSLLAGYLKTEPKFDTLFGAFRQA